MRLRASTLILIVALAGCMTPEEIEQANTRLEVATCSQRASARYDECVAACNNNHSAVDARTTCDTNADNGMMNYLRGVQGGLQGAIPEGLSNEIRDKFRAWRTEKNRCADQDSVEDAREDCIGGGGFLSAFPSGCEAARRDTYAGCIGECPAEQTKGTLCQPVSNRIPSWAECGTWQPDGTGACKCASDEFINRDNSFCFEFAQAMQDPRYGADCNGNPQDAIRFAPYVLRNELNLPSGIDFKCVPWVDGVPNFRGEAAVEQVAPGGVADENSCPSNLDEPGVCDERDGRCAVGTDADDCAVSVLDEEEEEDRDPELIPAVEPASAPANDVNACACGLSMASTERTGPCDCAGTWRVVHVSNWNADVSQVCRSGRWLTFNWSPRDPDACCGGTFDGCCQATDPAIGCD